MFWSKNPKADLFERERLLYLTQIEDLRSELATVRAEAIAERTEFLARFEIEREKLVNNILAIGYPRVVGIKPPLRSKQPAEKAILTPGYRPDLRPPDPLAEDIAPEAMEAKTVEQSLASLLVPPTFANNRSESTDN